MQSLDHSLSRSQKQDDHWTHHQKRRFKRALNEFTTDTPDFYEKVASKVPGKDVEQVKKLFETCYRLEGNVHVLVSEFENDLILPPTVSAKEIPNIRNKRPPIWTRNEHENFLLGMRLYGPGKWKQIADNCIPSKTAAQVSAHALDYLRKENADTITAAAISVSNKILEASSKRKVVVKDDRKDDDVIVLDTVPADFHRRKVQRTLNLFPLVPADHASSSSRKQEAEEEEGEDCTLNLFPTHDPIFT